MSPMPNFAFVTNDYILIYNDRLMLKEILFHFLFTVIGKGKLTIQPLFSNEVLAAINV